MNFEIQYRMKTLSISYQKMRRKTKPQIIAYFKIWYDLNPISALLGKKEGCRGAVRLMLEKKESRREVVCLMLEKKESRREAVRLMLEKKESRREAVCLMLEKKGD